MKEQMHTAEQKAGVKTSRLLLELLDQFSDLKGRDGLAIKQLANLYRCIDKKGTVIWITDDDDALVRAEKLDFQMAELRAGQMDTASPVEVPENDGPADDGGAASSAPTATVGQIAAQSKGCTIL